MVSRSINDNDILHSPLSPLPLFQGVHILARQPLHRREEMEVPRQSYRGGGATIRHATLPHRCSTRHRAATPAKKSRRFERGLYSGESLARRATIWQKPSRALRRLCDDGKSLGADMNFPSRIYLLLGLLVPS